MQSATPPAIPTLHPGPTNSIVDVAGLKVGHHERIGDGWLSGTTVVLTPESGATAGVDVRGGGPGTRETDLLDPRNLVERVHAISLSGGSAFGLAAATGVMDHLYESGVGFPMGRPGEVVPIVPGAVIFDLARGGNFAARPDASFGREACLAATGEPPRLGTVGAGTGAECGGLKGGIGSASAVLPDGTTVAALIVVNAAGSACDPRTGVLFGQGLLLEEDLADLGPGGGPLRLGVPDPAEVAGSRELAALVPTPGLPATFATTIGVVATDATLTKAQCAKVAGIGHDGMARGLNPVHTMFDGDTLFTLATGERGAPDLAAFHGLLSCAADVVTRAIVRGVLAATSVTTPVRTTRSWADAFPSARG
ncbi:P1 family peptidase [Janibacter sp. G56]|uniref:P1 family peptidase n=1 Tax=Janibacter sp. G56 TaxID=3418717 RepID=UPI003D054458